MRRRREEVLKQRRAAELTMSPLSEHGTQKEEVTRSDSSDLHACSPELIGPCAAFHDRDYRKDQDKEAVSLL